MRKHSTAGCAPSRSIRLPLPDDVGFRAGRAFGRYRRAGGLRRSPLPDFYIGAHAVTEDLTPITCDVGRYRTYSRP